MNKTPNYQLNQWEATDKVQRVDFNADNAKLDAALVALSSAKGNCEILFGTYTGDGQSVSKTPKTLTFPKKPLVVLIGCEYSTLIAVRGAARGCSVSNGSGRVNTLTWAGTSVSWTAEDTYGAGMNVEGTVYYYVAFMEA